MFTDDMLYCPKCKTIYFKEKKKCPYCGAKNPLKTKWILPYLCFIGLCFFLPLFLLDHDYIFEFLKDRYEFYSPKISQLYHKEEAEFIPVENAFSLTFYYDQLNDKQKYIYDKILSEAEDLNTDVYFFEKNLTPEDLRHVINALSATCPQYYWLNYLYNYYERDNSVYQVVFSKDSSDYIPSYQKAKELAESLKGENAYQTLCNIQNYLLENIEYDKDYTKEQDYRSALFEHKSVCAGYAYLFCLLAQENGIEAYYVSGETYSESDDWHAWCLIRTNNHYYWCDPTWDDNQDTIYDHFMVDDSIMLETHFPKDEFDYPFCDDVTFVFKEYENTDDIVVMDYNVNELEDQIITALKKKNTTIRIHFYRTSDANEFYEYFFSKDAKRCFKVIRSVYSKQGLHIQYSLHNKRTIRLNLTVQ